MATTTLRPRWAVCRPKDTAAAIQGLEPALDTFESAPLPRGTPTHRCDDLATIAARLPFQEPGEMASDGEVRSGCVTPLTRDADA